MERLKSAVPAELRRAVGEGTAADLPAITSRLLAFFDSLPLFHEVMRELTDPDLSLCRKDKGRAVELKGQGNACFSRREFGEALRFYSQALRHVPINSDGMDVNLVSAIYVNRASTMHKLGLFKESLRDCNRAVTISPNYAKAWYRKGMVKASLKNYSSAILDLDAALSMEVTSLGKSNIERELKWILQKHENDNEAEASNCDSKDADLPLEGQLHKVIIESVSTPDKGRGMVSTDDILPASLVHVEDPLAADLVHHYDKHSPANKLESQIYAIVLLLCLQNHYKSDLLWTEDSLSQLVLLIFQIKINSIAIVRMGSMDGGPELTVNKGVSAAEGANMCSLEQVRVAQAIYVSGSLFNHSCRPNVHAYFLSRTLIVRSTEFIKSGSPVEISYGPQAGEMHLPERWKSLQENYYFSCQCSSCSELNLSDLVMNSFCCPQSNCLGAISESTYYMPNENFVHVSLGGSYVYKLSLPDVSKVGKDMEKVASALIGNTGVSLNINPGCCMNCRSHIDVSSAVVTSHREASKIDRLKEITLLNKALIPEALQSLKQLKKLRHLYSKALAQAEDTIAEAFAKVGDQEQAQKHCEASIQILEKLYHPKHIAIAHERIKLVSILLSQGDRASAAVAFARAEAIFSLYYGSHMEKILAYLGALKRAVYQSTEAC
ncbi:unnamed protein product [Urochloa humidicola]